MFKSIWGFVFLQWTEKSTNGLPTFCYVWALRFATFGLRGQCFSNEAASFWPSLCMTAAAAVADAGPG